MLFAGTMQGLEEFIDIWSASKLHWRYDKTVFAVSLFDGDLCTINIKEAKAHLY